MHPTTPGKARQRVAGIHTGEIPIVDGLRLGLAGAGLDCRCKSQAERVLDQVDEIRRADALKEARRMRDAIAVVMVLLTELDELSADESDLSAYGEIADLFEDLADHASRGAMCGRLLARGRAAAHEGAPA